MLLLILACLISLACFFTVPSGLSGFFLDPNNILHALCLNTRPVFIFAVAAKPCQEWLCVRLKQPWVCPDGHQFSNPRISEPVACVCVTQQ